MRLLKDTFKRIILMIVLISIVITFLATPAAYAKLDLQDGDFYYSGTTKGTYVPADNIFSWLINALGQIADFILGLLSLLVRMPFIGWTALLEKMLTWALESTMGVSADGSMVGTSVNEEGELEVNSGDLTGLTNSSNNVTVEAIVYNRVAALDVDIFDLEFDRTLSATGQKLVCKKCEKLDTPSGSGQTEYTAKYVEDCFGSNLETVKAAADEVIAKRLAGEEVEPLKIEDYCNCDCGGCDACRFYLAQLQQNEPIIFQIKKLVATWYTIIRYLAIAAMLLVLIGVGIKMALSTIASDKAVFKQMLFDWCAGFIILFSIHYFMMFVIQVNEVLVNTIADSAQSINKVQMKQLGLEEAEFTDSELELKIYEEVRTRAYDAKVSNGMIGTVMYMSLVFLAFKYVVIYLKRLLTIIVLTLMAPAIGVAYALQKALSGKSAALKTWMTEYIMNVIIQTVHALIYSIFISQALIMSLQNVAGMLMALILMNYTSKADDLFKKIFKFGGGDSLLGHTEGAADAFKQNMDAALGIAAGAKPAAKMLTNTPYGKVVKGAGKAAVAAGVGALAGGRALYRAGLRKLAGDEVEESEPAPEQDNTGNDNGVPGGLPVNGGVKNPGMKDGYLTDAQLREAGGHQLKFEMDEAKHAMKAEKKNPDQAKRESKKQNYEAKRRNYNRFKALAAPTTGKIVAGHLDRLISMENVFTTGKPTGKFAPFKTAWVAAMGTSHYDKKKGKWVNDGNSIFDQMRASELLGLTDKDKKLLKDFGGDMMQGLIGMGSLFVGMGTFVTSPKVGMALLAKGVSSTNKVFGRDTNLARTPAKYKFGRFSPQSIDTMRNAAIAKAEREHDDLLAADLKRKYPNLVSRIKSGALKGVTVAGIESGSLLLTGSAGLAASTFLPTAAVVGGATMIGTRLTRNSKISGKLAEIDKHHTKQQKELIDKFNKEANKEMINSSKVGTEYATASFMDDLEDEFMGEAGEAKRKEAQKAALESAEYNEKDGTIKVKTAVIEEDEIKVTKKAEIKRFDSAMIATAMDKELDRIIAEMTSGGTIDIGNKSVQDDIIKRLSLSLEGQKILEKGEQAFRLLKGGQAELIRKVKIKTAVRNKAVEDAQEELEKHLLKDERKKLDSVIGELLKEEQALVLLPNDKREKTPLERIDINKVMERLNLDGSRQANPNDGSRQASKNDGAQQVKEVDPAKQQAIKKYLEALSESRVKEAVTISGDIAHEAAQDIQAKAVRKKKTEHISASQKKLQQVLSVVVEDEQNFLYEETVGNRKVVRIDATQTSSGNFVVNGQELSEREYAYANEVVRSLLDMKRTNEMAILRDPEIKKGGTMEYAAMMQTNSMDVIGMAENRKQELTLGIERASATQERIVEIDNTIKALQQNTAERQSRIDANTARMSTIGPVENVSDYIGKSLFKTKGRKVR